jgi:hypothetical protein
MPVTLTVARPVRESFVREPGGPLRIWAYRGGSSAAPENTAASDEVRTPGTPVCGVPTLASPLAGFKARGGNLLLEIKGALTFEVIAPRL